MHPGRCPQCEDIEVCPHCGSKIRNFRHVGVRSTGIAGSSIWHYSEPCGHRISVESRPVAGTLGRALAVYNGGPLWNNGYGWFNIFWGKFWDGQPLVEQVNRVTADIEASVSYSGGLSQYNVGIGKFSGSTVVTSSPSHKVSNIEIGTELAKWIRDGTIPNLGTRGAYNVFLPPGITALLGNDSSCAVFCDYHDTANGDNGPFFTCEPYPCNSGCNQCTSLSLDTLTQGLSEEMVELKTDMNPGTGWTIGTMELCDYCDQNFVCNRISTGEYVNAWYSNATDSCWKP